ncbi:MAG: 7-cyano-7-deazaguanine synthase, partial [Methylococcaceae bacterium]
AWGEVLGVQDIFIGVNAVDYSGYPDCRPEFIAAFENLANLATKSGIKGKHFIIHAPFIHLGKAEIIRTGIELGVDYSHTISCYSADADGLACRVCDACRLRAKGFIEAKIQDPTRYKN